MRKLARFEKNPMNIYASWSNTIMFCLNSDCTAIEKSVYGKFGDLCEIQKMTRRRKYVTE